MRLEIVQDFLKDRGMEMAAKTIQAAIFYLIEYQFVLDSERRTNDHRG